MSNPATVPDRDTILVTVYSVVDDVYQASLAEHTRRRRAGQFQPRVSDSEVLTLMVLGQWQPDRSERAFLDYVAQHWRAYFPRQLSQSAFNRRARDLWGLLAALGPLIAAWVRDHLGQPRAEYEVIDGVPVLLVRGCRGQRHPLFGLVAAFGRGGADKARYFGSKLLVSVGATPLIWGAVVGPANTEERWLLEALLTWRCAPTLPLVRPEELASVLGPAHRQQGQRQGPTGWLGPRYAAGSWGPGVYYGDLNYTGAAWQRHWTAAYEVTVSKPSSACASHARSP